ncbi:MAG: DUF333 domain-containing protein [Methanocellales archaeon]
MKSKSKLLYGILSICVLIAAIGLFMYFERLTFNVEIKLNYSISGCGEKEEREYTKTRGLEEKVEVRIDNSFINLTHYLNYVCCARIKIYLDSLETYQNYTLIKIKEKNEGEMCRCICDYQVNMKIGPLEKGKYWIQIWGIEFERAAGELLWEKEVIIGIEEEPELPNPASIYCLEQGGKLEIRKDKEGNEYGVCVFPDGSECEEWEFYRGECKPLSNFCGWSTYGNCSSDLDCIKSGCSGQVCQSKQEKPVITTCEWRDCYDAKPYGLECKCINQQCQWHR